MEDYRGDGCGRGPEVRGEIDGRLCFMGLYTTVALYRRRNGIQNIKLLH